MARSCVVEFCKGGKSACSCESPSSLWQHGEPWPPQALHWQGSMRLLSYSSSCVVSSPKGTFKKKFPSWLPGLVCWWDLCQRSHFEALFRGRQRSFQIAAVFCISERPRSDRQHHRAQVCRKAERRVNFQRLPRWCLVPPRSGRHGLRDNFVMHQKHLYK